MAAMHSLRICLLCLLLGAPILADQQPASLPSAQPESILVVDGYLVVHLPREDVTVVGRPAKENTVDTGWATWSQRRELLWKGEMEDSQGRLYNVRILPGYVMPWNEAKRGWTDAGHALADYGKADTWNTMGRHMKNTFKWGWETSFWEFGMKGTKEAWKEHFNKASLRTSRKTFGWPLAYPWAFVAALFESALRVPLGAGGAVIGTAMAGVGIPVLETAWPTVKATWHAGVSGTVMPVVAWTWHTVAAMPTAMFVSAPTPARADGMWMKLVEPEAHTREMQAKGFIPESTLSDLALYATKTAALDADPETSLTEVKRREKEELDALKAKYELEAKAINENRSKKLQEWLSLPENRQAIERLAQNGGDVAAIRAASASLVLRLKAGGMSEADAQAIVRRLVSHPITHRESATPPSYDKTDPLRGALDTMKRVDIEASKPQP